jgi:hypothetical protein
VSSERKLRRTAAQPKSKDLLQPSEQRVDVFFSRWQDEDFDEIHPLVGPNRKDHVIQSKDCYYFNSQPSQDRVPGTITGMTVQSGYLEDACYGYTPAAVHVYNADIFGYQRLLETLQGAQAPSDVKAGP